MSKSAIYVINTTSGTSIAAGGTYPITQVVRRFGCDLKNNGTGITASNTGYYKINANITAVATGAGVVTATLYNNGVAIPGANASVTATEGGTINLSINTILRLTCCANPADITIGISAAATTVNGSITAFKL